MHVPSPHLHGKMRGSLCLTWGRVYASDVEVYASHVERWSKYCIREWSMPRMCASIVCSHWRELNDIMRGAPMWAEWHHVRVLVWIEWCRKGAVGVGLWGWSDVVRGALGSGQGMSTSASWSKNLTFKILPDSAPREHRIDWEAQLGCRINVGRLIGRHCRNVQICWVVLVCAHSLSEPCTFAEPCGVCQLHDLDLTSNCTFFSHFHLSQQQPRWQH
jgi:hypothetical protein